MNTHGQPLLRQGHWGLSEHLTSTNSILRGAPSLHFRPAILPTFLSSAVYVSKLTPGHMRWVRREKHLSQKPRDLSLSPRTHRKVKGEKQLHRAGLCSPDMYGSMCVHVCALPAPHTSTFKKETRLDMGAHIFNPNTPV